MGLLQILFFVIFGVALLWFGYSMLIGQWEKIRADSRGYSLSEFGDSRLPEMPFSPDGPGLPNERSLDDPQSCPLCSVRLNRGELVNTHAFPSITGGKDRIMHVLGCAYCIGGKYKRKCPVCGSKLHQSEFLVARLFERKRTRNHVHILGCVHCRKHKVM